MNQHPANLAAAAASKSPIGAPAACPLRQTHVQLLPLRYGLVEKNLDPGAELEMPYALTARPLGIRLLRDGWLYLIDSASGELYEYRVLDGVVSALLHKGKTVSEDQRAAIEERPALIFSRQSTLYVTFAEVQWSAAKCRQVLDSAEERKHFMQAVDLGPVHCQLGGEHLLTVAQAQHWLAEVASGAEPASDPQTGEVELPAVQVSDAPEHEREPYLWEQPRRFRAAHIGEFLGRVRAPYQDDTLFLLVNDDLGVMRDLADYQDTVVGWVDDWSKVDNNQRDYLLACYIESLSQLSDQDIDSLAKASGQPQAKALFAELEQLPEPDRENTRQALLDYLNKGGKVEPSDTAASPELEQLRDKTLDRALELNRFDGVAPDFTAHDRAMADADRRYYTRQYFEAVAPGDFVERHLSVLVELGKDQDLRMRNVLDGPALSGKRGVNDLIDRPAMDEALNRHRDDLGRWNRLLDRITADRTQLLCAGRYHRSAWYYDAQVPAQLGQAFTAEYACLKDLCRSDAAAEQWLGYLEEHPELTRALFYTLPLRLQSEQAGQYSTLFNAGMAMFNNLAEWLATLRNIEQPQLPALDDLPDPTRSVAEAVQHTYSPALNLGLARVLEGFDLSAEKIPDLDELFQRLPKGLKLRLFDAARTSGVTFTVASPAEQAALQREIKDLLSERDYLKTLDRERNQLTRNKNRQGHKTPRAVELQHEIVRVRAQLAQIEVRLAKALSPIPEVPDESARLYGATQARAGVTVMFPSAQQQELRGLLGNIRSGLGAVSTGSLVKTEGMGLVVVLVQVVNLVGAYREVRRQARNERVWKPFAEAVAATGAAGFTAAQSLADTAMKARSTALVAGLQHHALQHIHVQMGRLHIGLGAITYLFGFFSSMASLSSQRKNWQQATRSGNRPAQGAAALATLGAGGMVTANAYGLSNTVHATLRVLTASNSAARKAAWAAAGTRLSTVFFRFNLAGSLFTVLELSGAWLFNRYNLSAHDKWLKTTPWSRDAEMRGDHSLDEYQSYLAFLIHAPYAQLGPNPYDSWLKNLLFKARPSDIHLVLPRVTLENLLPPFGGKPTHRLGIGAHRISMPLHSQGAPRESKEVISDEVVSSLRIVKSTPEGLVLCLRYPVNPGAEYTPAKETLELAVCIQTLNAKGQWTSRTPVIHIDPSGEGHFSVVASQLVKEKPPVLHVETEFLEQADHAE
ncbi:toxin VasX [Pseudomonas moorei]|uniref:toxin VasX n=1 Tax=Pseudomonas moorei TaxID=395599 RepID=UPI00200D4FA8|nr:toxin VasX [Pseudomonas moorei]